MRLSVRVHTQIHTQLPRVRESFRYLGILPMARLDDGRLDWESQHFAFDVNIRNARLERAVNYDRRYAVFFC